MTAQDLSHERPVRVQAKVDLGPAESGGSQSRFIRCFDSQRNNEEIEYLVKFRENPQGLRVLVNELVCGLLATRLELPCPEVAVVEVSDDFAKAAKDAGMGLVESGEHHGMRRLKNMWRNPPPDALRRVHNKNDFAAMVAFDAWVYNQDRKLSHILLV